MQPDNLDGTSMGVKGLVCAKYTDEEYKREHLQDSEEEYLVITVLHLFTPNME